MRFPWRDMRHGHIKPKLQFCLASLCSPTVRACPAKLTWEPKLQLCASAPRQMVLQRRVATWKFIVSSTPKIAGPEPLPGGGSATEKMRMEKSFLHVQLKSELLAAHTSPVVLGSKSVPFESDFIYISLPVDGKGSLEGFGCVRARWARSGPEGPARGPEGPERLA